MASGLAAAAVAGRLRGALMGMLVADALSMPVHWYYDTRALEKEFGYLTTYQPAPKVHPTSIMHCSSTRGGGREGAGGGGGGEVVGKIILHGKEQFWGGRNRGIHYHHGMEAGENTLTILLGRLIARTVTENGGKYDPKQFLDRYVAFMTGSGTHNDTYADSFHREFFYRQGQGVPYDQCVGPEMHDTAQVGGLVMLIPVTATTVANAVVEAGGDMAKAADAAKEKAVSASLTHLRLTHNSPKLERYASEYAEVLASVLLGEDLREAVVKSGQRIGVDIAAMAAKDLPDKVVAGRLLGIACYISDAYPIILYLAYKYHDRPAEGIYANTNCGGENCQRGACLGALLVAANGAEKLPENLVNGLKESQAIDEEITGFVGSVLQTSA